MTTWDEERWSKEEFPKQYIFIKKAWDGLIKTVYETVLDLHQTVLVLRGFNRAPASLEMPLDAQDFQILYESIIKDLSNVLDASEKNFFDDFFSQHSRPDFDVKVLQSLLKKMSSMGYQEITYETLCRTPGRINFIEAINTGDHRPFVGLYLSLALYFKLWYSQSWVYAGCPGRADQEPWDYMELFIETNVIFEVSARVMVYVETAARCSGYILAKTPEKISTSRKGSARVLEKTNKTIEFLEKNLGLQDKEFKKWSKLKRDELKNELGVNTPKHVNFYLEKARKSLNTQL